MRSSIGSTYKKTVSKYTIKSSTKKSSKYSKHTLSGTLQKKNSQNNFKMA